MNGGILTIVIHGNSMTIYVDPLRRYPQPAKRGARHVFGSGRMSCHMISDVGHTELITFARRIGMRDEWYQPEHGGHFDLTERRRNLAVRAGAVEVSREVFMSIIRDRNGMTK